MRVNIVKVADDKGIPMGRVELDECAEKKLRKTHPTLLDECGHRIRYKDALSIKQQIRTALGLAH